VGDSLYFKHLYSPRRHLLVRSFARSQFTARLNRFGHFRAVYALGVSLELFPVHLGNGLSLLQVCLKTHGVVASCHFFPQTGRVVESFLQSYQMYWVY
jgi:hypothetical protein